MNADSGEILIMASHPYFDPTTLEEDWETLVTDETAPLLNRATQGLYPAGGALFPLVLTTQLDTLAANPDPEALFPEARLKLDCASPLPATFTWTDLVTHGCQNVQANLAEITGVATLETLYQSLGLYAAPNLNLPVAAVEQPNITDETAFFRGEEAVNVSPLQMALAVSALSNGGTVPAPRIVNSYLDPEDNWVALPKLSNSHAALGIDETSTVTNLLRSEGSPFWVTAASAHTEENETITWAIGGTSADWQGQPFAVVVVLEKDDPAAAQSIAASLMTQAMRLSAWLTGN